VLAELGSLADLRDVIRKSSNVGRFEPKPAAMWWEGEEQYRKLSDCGTK